MPMRCRQAVKAATSSASSLAKSANAAQASVSHLAKEIAERAMAVGQRKGDPEVETPFGQASANEGRAYVGGKLDDVAIVCGVVREGVRPGFAGQP